MSRISPPPFEDEDAINAVGISVTLVASGTVSTGSYYTSSLESHALDTNRDVRLSDTDSGNGDVVIYSVPDTEKTYLTAFSPAESDTYHNYAVYEV